MSDLNSVLNLMREGHLAESREAAGQLDSAEAQTVSGLVDDLNSRFVLAARAISSSLVTGAAELQATTELTQITHRLSDDAARLSAMAEEMTSSLTDVATKVATASAGATQAVAEAEQGQNQVQGALQALARFGTAFHDVEQQALDLRQQVDRVKSILDIVRKVSDQTRLLSLNASIEAARAGAAGRGFAVVAEEIRRLSDETRHALKDAVSTVSAIESGGATVAELAATVAKEAEAESARVDSAQAALASIGMVTRQAATELSTVAAATGEQVRAVDEVSSVASELAAAVGQVERVATAVAASAATLQKQTAGARRAVTSMHLLLGDDDILELAKADHIHWVTRLQNLVAGKDQLRPEQILPACDCRLGKWLEAHHREQDPACRRLAEVHDLLHDVPRRLIVAWNGGRKAEAQQLLAQTASLGEEMLSLTAQVQQTL